jgi:hypothetical protein
MTMMPDHKAFWLVVADYTRRLADERGWHWDDCFGWLPIVGDGPGDIKQREIVRWRENAA